MSEVKSKKFGEGAKGKSTEQSPKQSKYGTLKI
jgi:hypothetical protein